MSEIQESSESRIELRQAVILLSLGLVPGMLSQLMIACVPGDSGGHPNMPGAGWPLGFGILSILSVTCGLAIPILILVWGRGLNARNIWQRVKARDFDKYMVIAFVPMVCFLVASGLQNKGSMIWHYSVDGPQDARAQIAYQMALSVFAKAKTLFYFLAVALIADARLRRWMLGASFLVPLLIQDFFAQIAHLRFPHEDSFVFQFAYPQFVHWSGWLTALVNLAIFVTLVEVFRPTLRIVAIYFVVNLVGHWFVRDTSGWYLVGELAIALLFVLTSWQLTARYPSEAA